MVLTKLDVGFGKKKINGGKNFHPAANVGKVGIGIKLGDVQEFLLFLPDNHDSFLVTLTIFRGKAKLMSLLAPRLAAGLNRLIF